MLKKFLWLFLFVSSQCVADLPKGCVLQKSAGDMIELSAKTSTLYYIQNVHDTDLYLAANNSTLTSKISPKLWSVLEVKKESNKFSCVESKPGSEQRLPCTNMVKICKLELKSNKGLAKNSDWLMKNKPLMEIIESPELISLTS